MARREGGRTTAVQDASRESRPQAGPPGFGLRQSSGALACERERGEGTIKPSSPPRAGKAVEDYRSPRRFATVEGAVKGRRGFGLGKASGALAGARASGEGKIKPSSHAPRWKSGRGLPQSKTLRDSRRRGESSASFWTAPVLWRFGVRTSERRGNDQTVVTRPALEKR